MLLVINKSVLTKHAEDMMQWLVYLVIRNLSYKIRKSQLKPGKIMVGFISIYKGDSFEVKMEIYY